MNTSETLVANLCKKGFLSLWSFPCPVRADNSKELCDVLIACEPYIIIVSVKEVNIKPSGNPEVDSNRWERKALFASFDQIYGAERALNNRIKLVTADEKKEIHLFDIKPENIFRLAVALGRGNNFSLKYGDFDKGYVHVLDEGSLDIVMKELDTITDFIEYLKAKETYSKGEHQIIASTEEDILVLYLNNNRSFPEQYNFIFSDLGSWNGLAQSESYIKKTEADKISYAWDTLIEHFSKYVHSGTLFTNPGSSKVELSLRIMAKEPRFARRILGQVMTDFFYSQNTRSRIVLSPSDVLYVFLNKRCRYGDNNARKKRTEELELRCIIAKNLNKTVPVVIGIASDPHKKGKPVSYDLSYSETINWSEEDIKRANEIQEKTGYFKNIIKTEAHVDEYPK